MDPHTVSRLAEDYPTHDQTMSNDRAKPALEQRLTLSSTDASARRSVRIPDDIYILIIEHAGTLPELKLHESFLQPTAGSALREHQAFARYQEVLDALSFLASAALVCKRWSLIVMPLLYRHLLPVMQNESRLTATLRKHPHLRALVRRISTRASPTMVRHLLPAGPWASVVRVETVLVDESLLRSGRDILVRSLPHLERLAVAIRDNRLFVDIALPDSLQSLTVHADWDSDLTFLSDNALSSLESLSLHMCYFGFQDNEDNELSLDDLLPARTALRLTHLRLSFWTDERDPMEHADVHGLLQHHPRLRVLSICGVKLESMLQVCRLEALETVEAIHAFDGDGVVTPWGLQWKGIVSFGYCLEDVDEAEDVVEAEDVSDSYPRDLVANLDRARFPSLRTLAVKSLDFSLASHRTGRLVLGHVARLRKIGIRIVDRHEVEFGQERAGWGWGKVAEEKEEGVQTAAVED